MRQRESWSMTKITRTILVYTTLHYTTIYNLWVREFYEREIEDAFKEDMLLLLHLKATRYDEKKVLVMLWQCISKNYGSNMVRSSRERSGVNPSNNVLQELYLYDDKKSVEDRCVLYSAPSKNSRPNNDNKY